MPKELPVPGPSPGPSVTAANGSSATNASPASLTSAAAHMQEAEDWHTKNARAKAIIMSTLIPGSEPWKIAEPLELASDIWKALEDRYAPKKPDPTSNESEKQASALERSDFVSEWVLGKSLAKYKRDKQARQTLEKSSTDALPPMPKNAVGATMPAEDREVAEFQARLNAQVVDVLQQKGKPMTHEQFEAEREANMAELQRLGETFRELKLKKQAAEAQKDSSTENGMAELQIASEETAAKAKNLAEKDRRRKAANAAAKKILCEHMPSQDQRLLWAVLHGGKPETTAWFNGETGG